VTPKHSVSWTLLRHSLWRKPAEEVNIILNITLSWHKLTNFSRSGETNPDSASPQLLRLNAQCHTWPVWWFSPLSHLDTGQACHNSIIIVTKVLPTVRTGITVIKWQWAYIYCNIITLCIILQCSACISSVVVTSKVTFKPQSGSSQCQCQLSGISWRLHSQWIFEITVSLVLLCDAMQAWYGYSGCMSVCQSHLRSVSKWLTYHFLRCQVAPSF